MKHKPTPQAQVPDLLTPVVDALKALDLKTVEETARTCGVSFQTLRNMRDGRTGPNGPGYQLVHRLYVQLVARQPEPARAA